LLGVDNILAQHMTAIGTQANFMGKTTFHKAAHREKRLWADLRPAFYRSTDGSMPVCDLMPDGNLFFKPQIQDTQLFKQ